MKILINNVKKWLSPKPAIEDDEPHINWFGVINRVTDDARDAAMKDLNLDDVCNHTEIGIAYTGDARLNLCADEFKRMRELS